MSIVTPGLGLKTKSKKVQHRQLLQPQTSSGLLNAFFIKSFNSFGQKRYQKYKLETVSRNHERGRRGDLRRRQMNGHLLNGSRKKFIF